ncbi:hypothetical protein THRCLA_20955 [Thraustotheca clavata]|uniref:Thioredoxin domain-containing protein n=1 Tax=Thraustotheca clavata TaxID=74557 RepID=A0A1W0A1M9_9STRA|nr:hypothetical protein THRCLA_20955 [Thraustotheca clavata]
MNQKLASPVQNPIYSILTMAIHTESISSVHAFQQEIARNEYKDRLVVVDFSASNCPPCQAMKPIVDTMAHDFENQVEFFEIDVNTNANVANALGIQAIPIFKFYRNGHYVDTLVGANPAPLRQLVAALK